MARKPRASLTASYVTLPSGKIRVTVSSNAKKVKLTYRTAANKKRTATITIRKGTGAKTLPKGSKRIVAQAKATSKLRTGVKIRVQPYTPPVVTPPVVTPPSAPDTTPPAAVTELTVTGVTASSVALMWRNPSDSDLALIIVRRATGTTPPASPTDGDAVALDPETANSVNDAGLTPATDYAYAVFTRDATGNTSLGVYILARTADRLILPAPAPKPVRIEGGATSTGREVPPRDDVRESLADSKVQYCTPTVDPQPADLNSALTMALALVVAREGQAAVDGFRQSPANADADAAMHAAAQAAIANKPGAALLALLRAHELDPTAAGPLASAAAILTTLDRPGLSLSLLDDAQGKGTVGDWPMEMRSDAMMHLNRGNALFRLGRYQEADVAFQTAQTLDSDLAEAPWGRALVALCLDNLDTAVEHYRKSARRGLDPSTPLIGDPNDTDGWGDQPAYDAVFNVSAGKPYQLPEAPVASDFPTHWQTHPRYQALQEEVSERVSVRNARRIELDGQMPLPGQRSSAIEEREADIIDAATTFIEEQPGLDALSQAVNDASAKRGDWEDQMATNWSTTWGLSAARLEAYESCKHLDSPEREQCEAAIFIPQCRAIITNKYNTWRPIAQEEILARRRWVQAAYPIQTGLAAGITNPLVHESLSLYVENIVDDHWYDMLGAAHSFGVGTDYIGCFDESVPEAVLSPEEPPRPNPCPSELDRYRPGFVLGVVSVQLDCSNVEVELSNPGWLGVFATAEHSYKAGTVTVFVGIRGSVNTPFTDSGVSLKEGFYVSLSTDPDSGATNVEEAGFRIDADATIGKGFFVEKGSESMTLAIVSSPKRPDGLRSFRW